jgi:hypothetical protein
LGCPMITLKSCGRFARRRIRPPNRKANWD